jgi:hypothetical protein
MESIEEYIAFLQPLVLAMLETKAASEKSNKKRRQPTVIGRGVADGLEEITNT